MIPIAIGFGVLRYRLYEIDVIIRRTLVYAALTATLAAVYLGGIALLGAVSRGVTGQSSALAVTISTLIVAVAFQPARSRIQRAVERRFYRGAYDVEMAVREFSGRLREQIELDALSDELLDIVHNTVQPRIGVDVASFRNDFGAFTRYNGGMTVLTHTIRRVVLRKPATAKAETVTEITAAPEPTPAAGPELEIAPNDPIIGYLQSAPGAVELKHLELESPALERMREQGITMVVPLVTQGELIGMLNLGPRLSDQEYSPDDRRLLESLASQAAPAVKVGQLVREQETEIRERERLEQELHVAQLIQQNFLPRHLPDLPGWQVAAYYRPARAVGGDFYDFIDLPDGLIGLVVGDVTDKGIPAAMVMAATRSVLRAAAQRLLDPGEVLERVNDHLCPEIPPNMFVTCFYGVLDPASGRLRYANAGHNLPFVCTAGEPSELRATGMPLGLMPDMRYEECEAVLEPGASVLHVQRRAGRGP